jgi:hypothetical protein
MATTSPFAHINEQLGIVAFCPEVLQGTPNCSFSASGGTTTTITVDVTSLLEHNKAIALAPADLFKHLQVYVRDGAEEGAILDITAFSVVGNVATFTVTQMPTGLSPGDKIYVFGMLPADDVSHSEAPEDLPRKFVRKTLDLPPSKKGLTVCSSSFKMEMPGLENSSADGIAASEDRTSKFLGFIGTRSAGQGDLVQAAPAPTTTDFTVSAGSRFTADQWVMVNGDVTQITAIATNALTVSPPLSQAPSAGDVVRAAEIITPDDSGHQTHTMLFLTDDRLTMHYGCVFSCKITADKFGSLVMMDIEGDAEDYSSADGVELDGSLAAAYDCIKFTNTAGCFFGTDELPVSSFEFDMAHTRKQMRDTKAGLRHDIRGRESSCKVTFRDTGKVVKTTWESDDSTLRQLLICAGSTPGECVAIAGQAQVESSAGTNQEDTRYWDTTFKFRDNHKSKTKAHKPLIMRF